VDKNPYHQVLTELPMVAAGTRAAQAVRVPVEPILPPRVKFVQTLVAGFDVAGRVVQTENGPMPYDRLVVALGSQPNDFGIPGLSRRALTLWSVDDARRVLAEVDKEVALAVQTSDENERKRHLTVAIGGGGATGVELAGELAEVLPELARRHDLPAQECRVVLIEAAPTLLTGSSSGLIERANTILGELGVEVRTSSPIAEARDEGFVLKSGEVVSAGVCVWCGGIKVAEVVARSGLGSGAGGRVPVDENLRVLDHPEIYVAGDAALVINPETGRALPPLAQIALEEGETVAHNLQAELEGKPLQAFTFRTKASSSLSARNRAWQRWQVLTSADEWRVCSKKPSSGSIGSRSSTCAAGVLYKAELLPAANACGDNSQSTILTATRPSASSPVSYVDRCPSN
jgi:NADH dehydrogenase